MTNRFNRYAELLIDDQPDDFDDVQTIVRVAANELTSSRRFDVLKAHRSDND